MMREHPNTDTNAHPHVRASPTDRISTVATRMLETDEAAVVVVAKDGRLMEPGIVTFEEVGALDFVPTHCASSYLCSRTDSPFWS